MACTLHIDRVRGILDSTTQQLSVIRIEGHIEGPPSECSQYFQVWTQDICYKVGGAGSTTDIDQSSFNWVIDANPKGCSCGKNFTQEIRVGAAPESTDVPGQADFESPILIRTSWSGPLDCGDCPIIDNVSIDVDMDKCYSGSRKVTFSVDISGGYATHYIWQFGDGSSDQIIDASQPNASPDVIHYYRASSTEENYNAVLVVRSENPSCTGLIRQIPVSIPSCPEPSQCPTISMIVVESRECIEESVRTIILDALIQGTGTTEYSWNFGDGSNTITQSTTPRISHDFPAPGDYTISLTITGPDHCSDTETLAIRVDECDETTIPGDDVPSTGDDPPEEVPVEGNNGFLANCPWWCILIGIFLIAIPISALISSAAHCLVTGDLLALQAAAIGAIIAWYIVFCRICCLWPFLYLGAILGVIATLIYAIWGGFPDCWTVGLSLLIGFIVAASGFQTACNRQPQRN